MLGVQPFRLSHHGSHVFVGIFLTLIIRVDVKIDYFKNEPSGLYANPGFLLENPPLYH